jgi:hypothetical protein
LIQTIVFNDFVAWLKRERRGRLVKFVLRKRNY